MIDVMDIKLKVIKAACGICALSEADLLRRLEDLYIDGMKAGADALKEATSQRIRQSGSTSKPNEAIADK